MRRQRAVVGAAILALLAQTGLADVNAGLANATVLIIRHAEKPDSGRGLNDQGRHHAEAYVKYFSDFVLDGAPLKVDALFAAADSKNSDRPRLTLEPLAHALNLPLDIRFKDKNPEALVAELKSKPHGSHLLICWRHGEIPNLLLAFGAAPESLLPNGEWPDDQYRWVIQLRYDSNGNLIPAQCRRIEQDIR